MVSEEERIEAFQDLTEGLRYAEIIQRALLPKERHFKRLFKESLVFFQPQNHVSGDFYWIGQKENLKYVVVGDCTGHGISAALSSVLAGNILEYLIMNKGIKKTNKILIELDNKFIESFSDADDKSFNNDWIDISICCIDETKKRLYYSSANRKMLHFTKDGKMRILKGSSYPIGGWQIETSRKFEATILKYNEGDTIYLGSDGMQDQIGGPLLKKYKSANLHRFLDQINSLTLKQQLVRIQNEFETWKGENPQQDDVCIIGIRL